MSRSAADATRFTPTGPYASSKSSVTNSTTSRWAGAGATSSNAPRPGSGDVPRESPKQKVERLRAEARASRYAKTFTPMDRFMANGRIWADRAHRVTVYTLIAASGVAAVLTVYSATSLLLYNRRQRQLWIDRELEKLLEARKAYVAGNATPEQLKVLEQDKLAEEENKRREELKKEKLFYKGKEWLFGGLKSEEGTTNTGVKGNDEIANTKPSVLEAVNAKRAETGAPFEQGPSTGVGQVQLNQKAGEGSTEPKRSWTSWITGR
ncbi:hypothetical protein AJ79_03490 [Helicocarpus griseus UAMH5409]|uniref:Uncharacterized protein n=1 Tax=Helicocarpus griseus UAMH5409 TaxID=1447875 RepID=A0A2B7XYE1_9EURO|nr:hypothetical protein AJ79_03490 [Helicocarpus griseus UAMH5409]